MLLGPIFFFRKTTKNYEVQKKNEKKNLKERNIEELTRS